MGNLLKNDKNQLIRKTQTQKQINLFINAQQIKQ